MEFTVAYSFNVRVSIFQKNTQVSFSEPDTNVYPRYPQTYDPNKRYGYGPYNSYGPNSYLNSNSQQPNLGGLIFSVVKS